MGKVIQLFDPKKDEPDAVAKLGQISLPFFARPKLHSVIAGHIADPETFARLVNALSISIVLDMRIAPRLDVVAGTRMLAFRYFESRGIQYRDVLGRVGATSYVSADMQAVVSEILTALKQVDVHSTPVLLIFESPAFQDVCTERLEGAFDFEVIEPGQLACLVEERLRM